MRFAIYSRKSVLTGRGESIENQVELCRSYLAAHYPGVRPEEVAVYEDEGFSGKDFQRPQFRRMLEDIRRGVDAQTAFEKNLAPTAGMRTPPNTSTPVRNKGEEEALCTV